MKGISIIIPCYNCENYINECIESIKNFGIKNKYEIILIEDCSSDKTKDVLGKVNDKNIRIYQNKQNKGVQYSRNKGLKLAQYDYVMTIDSDDKLNAEMYKNEEKTFIDKAIDALEKNENIAFVQGIWKMFWEFEGNTITTYPLNEKLIVNKHHVQTSIIHRKSDNVFYDEEIKKWQDWSFAIALLNKRYKEKKKNEIFFIEEPYYLYRIYSSNKRISSIDISENAMIEKTVTKNQEIFYKYFPNNDLKEIVKKVYDAIPSKLESLLYVANNNLEIALQMMKEREYYVASPTEPHNFP